MIPFTDTNLRIAVFLLEVSLTLTIIMWMRMSIKSHRESWFFFFKLLLWGGVAAIISAVVEIKYSIDPEELQKVAPDLVARYGTVYELINNAAASFIEEIAKYTVAVFTILTARQVHKLSDAIIYLILIGLGFSLVEDIVFLLSPDTIAPYRLLSFFVHSGTSAVIGYSLGRYMSGVARYPELIISVLGAVALHFCYNLSTSLQDNNTSFLLTVAITVYISLQLFILFRKAIEEEYRLGHRFKGQTTHRLLNLRPAHKRK
jgi:RsiW-degrading membrane proteinase PrsW (M82 family)